MDIVGDRRRNAVGERLKRVFLGLVPDDASEGAGIAVEDEFDLRFAGCGEVHGKQADLLGIPDEGKILEILLNLLR